jgi:hypothetical protein
VLGAGEDREAFVDVAVDLGELPPRVSDSPCKRLGLR